MQVVSAKVGEIASLHGAKADVLEKQVSSLNTAGEVTKMSTRTTCDVLVALEVVQQEAAQNLAVMMQGIQALSHEDKECWAALELRVLDMGKTVQTQTRENNRLENKFKELATKMQVYAPVSRTVLPHQALVEQQVEKGAPSQQEE
ncbi:hypothetical protein CBOM_07363 [Ceraceosorus bombacis]|uniref:Uncharacterized protein n=1 Tax=Ceraceosorus bombacis TaxID=401625 RepID=A0A0P1B8W7_9BASI|nr:hypothetical protein CBOM_07363 [Ceraceosorus bombacis]